MKHTSICLALTALAAFAQTKPAFEVATVKPSAPPDMAKLRAAAQGGGKMPFGPKVDSSHAEYTFMDLKSPIALAYGVRPGQIAGPDWMESTAFDIVAKLPDGASKDDAPKMLQTLLEERFKMTVRRTNTEHPVLALVVGKSGLKMKPSPQTPVARDDSAPSGPGETTLDMAPGIKMIINTATGAGVLDLGSNGKVATKMNMAARTSQTEYSMVTMGGLASWLTVRSTNNGGPQVVDMTGLTGNYDASMEADMSPADPADGMSAWMTRLTNEVQALGLKLESRKAVVEQLVIDHVEKTPTAN